MRDVYLFVACLVLIAGLGIGGFHYQTQVTGQLVKDYTLKINTLTGQLDQFNQEYSKEFSAQQAELEKSKKKIDTVEKKLDIKSQEFETKVGSLQSNIDTVKDLSEQQIADLSGKLKQVELKSVSQLSDLKDQLNGLGLSQGFADIIEQVLPAVVSINTNGGIGSGAVFSQDGYIITNKHVATGSSTVTVKTFDKKQYTANVIGESATKDIAVIKINANNIPFLSFANSDNVKVGESVIALGSPGGLDFTVTEGIISATNRIINTVNHLQTDVPINPGNSGSPLVNKAGQVVGINTMKVQGFEGVGFSITSNEAQAAIREITSQ